MAVRKTLMALVAVLAVLAVAGFGATMASDEADAMKEVEIVLNNSTASTYTIDTDTILTITGGLQTVQYGGMWWAETRNMYVAPTNGLTITGDSLDIDGSGTSYAYTSLNGTLPYGSYAFIVYCGFIGQVHTFTVNVNAYQAQTYQNENASATVGQSFAKTLYGYYVPMAAAGGVPTISGASWISVSSYNYTIQSGSWLNSGTNSCYSVTVSGTPTTAGTYNVIVTIPTTSNSAQSAVPVQLTFTVTVVSVQQYAVSYSINDQYGYGSTTSQTVTAGSSVSLRSCGFTVTGYTFSGWKANNTGSILSAGSTYTPSASVTMYAQWTVNTYTITFDPNGGSCSTASKTVTYWNQIGTLPTPTRAGYTFDGWYTSTTTSSSAWKSTDYYRYARDYTLYAHWSAASYTVTLSVGAGSVSPTSMTVTYGSAYSGLPTPTPAAGYVFDGWYTASSGGTQITASTAVTATANHTLYARYTEDTTEYTIAFNANGGAGAINSQYKMINQTITLPSSGFTRTDYNMSSWTLGSTTGTSYSLGETVTVTGAMTFYAVWTANSADTDSNAPSTGTVGVLYTYNPSTTSGTTWAPFTYATSITVNQLPSWLTFDQATITFSGTPTSTGLYTVDVTANSTIVPGSYPGSSLRHVCWTITVSEPEPNLYTVTYDVNGGIGSVAQVTDKEAGDIIRLTMVRGYHSQERLSSAGQSG
jgi:uncharacterized repeat protein (TIGR02543 family)